MTIDRDKRYTISLFIFRRDMRCDDNIGLAHALAMSGKVMPCFIFDEAFLVDSGSNALQFMYEALADLDATLHKKGSHLYYFHGSMSAVIKKLMASVALDAIFINRDYTPLGIAYQSDIADLCAAHHILFNIYDDAVLVAPEAITKRAGGHYTIFTPFCKALLLQKPQPPISSRLTNFYSKKLSGTCALPQVGKKKGTLAVHGRRADALLILKNIADYTQYDRQRNMPALDATTHLSAFIACGLCSVREVYQVVVTTLGAYHTLIKQLCWHDFFISIALHHPEVFGNAFHKKYNKLAWKNNRADFKRWCNGTTGFPIVDAGMRELNATGFMHNRVRMIVASFLIKDLHIDWQWGEKYFASKLVDYDQAVNNGNWQWVASTGCDAQPYFRIFNPWLQQKTYDRECVYIKRWVPELAEITNKDIHAWYKAHVNYQGVYHTPMVDHATESAVTKIMYKKVV